MRLLIRPTLLLLFSLPAYADPGIKWATTSDLMRAAVPVLPNPASGFTIACGVPLDDIVAGETIVADGNVNMTNNTGVNVGITTEFFTCNAGVTKCRNLRGSYSALSGNNITPQIHHQTYQPKAMVPWLMAQPRTWVMLIVRAYSTGSKPRMQIAVDRCGALIARYHP